MTKEELAARLDGRQYREEITSEEIKVAKESNLVVAFGCSDDLLEFRGAIEDEFGAYDGCRVAIFRDGSAAPSIDADDFTLIHVKAEWCPCDGSGISWRVTSDIPFAKFTIFEDDEPFCEGAVFEFVKGGAVDLMTILKYIEHDDSFEELSSWTRKLVQRAMERSEK